MNVSEQLSLYPLTAGLGMSETLTVGRPALRQPSKPDFRFTAWAKPALFNIEVALGPRVLPSPQYTTMLCALADSSCLSLACSDSTGMSIAPGK